MTQKNKQDWQIKKLGDLCIIELGKTPYRGNHKFWDTEKLTKNVWLSIADLLNTEGNVIFDSKEYISDKGAELSKIVKKGTLLVSFKLTLGRLAFAGKNLYTNEAIAALTIRNEKEISKDYLYHFLRFFDWHGAVQGDVKIKGKTLNKAKLKEIIISYPKSLSEQRHIVQILDEVFEKTAKAKENAEKNLQNAKDLFESYLQSVFANPGENWEEKSLDELGQITSSKRIYRKEYAKTGVPFYRIKEIKELAHGKNITIELYISNDRYNAIKDVFGVPVEGDILMTAVGTIGEIYVVKNDEKFYFKDGNVLWFKDFNSVDPYFLKFVLMSFVEKIKKLSKGAAYSALTIEKIEKHRIFIPRSLREQKAIVSKLDALSAETQKLESIYKQKLTALEELKKSVLKKAFAGEL
ncbi:restriction endonuclease subunit S [Patescibacteria group bacterium]|nr:restriction endonuclease subunit S [Patescibacteria group bacterium]MBU1963007.1 restriction endonuclease subunit S [Patescibacteria group bacterium]